MVLFWIDWQGGLEGSEPLYLIPPAALSFGTLRQVFLPWPGYPWSMPKYWVNVASRDHVMRGVSGGFIQSGHGKRAGLARMHRNDGVICYSPRIQFGGDGPLHAFTALGYIADDEIFQVDESPDFKPFRRRVNYMPAHEVRIEPLVPDLGFIRNKKAWGYVFRFGLVEIPEQDFLFIAGKMGVKGSEPGP